jgi:hypothetical protein
MKDIFCVAAFAGKVLCLMVFVTVLKPDGSIGAIRTSTKPVDCRMERPGMQECGLNVFAAASHADARPCITRPSVAHC